MTEEGTDRITNRFRWFMGAARCSAPADKPRFTVAVEKPVENSFFFYIVSLLSTGGFAIMRFVKLSASVRRRGLSRRPGSAVHGAAGKASALALKAAAFGALLFPGCRRPSILSKEVVFP